MFESCNGKSEAHLFNVIAYLNDATKDNLIWTTEQGKSVLPKFKYTGLMLKGLKLNIC